MGKRRQSAFVKDFRGNGKVGAAYYTTIMSIVDFVV
jgi:hypothetical protein